jgi:hypothetical protein
MRLQEDNFQLERMKLKVEASTKLGVRSASFSDPPFETVRPM